MNQADRRSSAERLSVGVRIALLVAAALMAVVLAGVFTGFIAAAIKHGHILPRKPVAWLILVAAFLAAFGLYRLMRWLSRPSLTAGMSAHGRRYWKAMLTCGLLGAPLGSALAMMTPREQFGMRMRDIFIDGPLPPVGAAALAAAMLVGLTTAAVVYHRAIDDHEERAYLWGSQYAYYFFVAAIALYWLLFRGGLLPPFGLGTAMLMLLISVVVQAGVWAWFKFR